MFIFDDAGIISSSVSVEEVRLGLPLFVVFSNIWNNFYFHFKMSIERSSCGILQWKRALKEIPIA
jgi:hypothetical protein